ncbi:MAG: hypothetical protein WC974_09425 [Thermoplasmata archaeon]
MLIKVILTKSEERLVSYYTKTAVKKLPTIYIADNDICHTTPFINTDIGRIYHKDGNVFVYINGSDGYEKWLLTVIAIATKDDDVALSTYNKFISNKAELYFSHKESLRYKERYEENFHNFLVDGTGLNIFSFKDYLKKLSKLKIPMEVIDIANKRYIKFTFKRVKVGNEIEGYVSYKSIELILDPVSFSLKDSIYTFNNFSVKSSEYLPISFHPHISTSICFGNMKDEYSNYIVNGFYDFALALIKESVHNYSSESPYTNIATIAKTVRACERLWKIEKNQHDNFMQFYGRCAGCGEGTVLNSDNIPECNNNHCRGNANASVNCDICGGRMTLVQPPTRDLAHSWAYRFECNCSVTCPYCGTVRARTSDCAGANCIYNPNAVITCWQRTRRRKVGGDKCTINMLHLGEKTTTGVFIWYCPLHDTKALKAKIALPEFEGFREFINRKFRALIN